jgi:hypothetical protein
MTKFLRSAALMAILAGGTTGLLTVTTNDTFAQEKGTKDTPKKGDKTEKGDKETPKKAEPKKAEKAGKFVVSEGKDKMFRFSIYDGEGKFLANSGANKFATEEEATKGVAAFKAIVKDAKIEATKD